MRGAQPTFAHGHLAPPNFFKAYPATGHCPSPDAAGAAARSLLSPCGTLYPFPILGVTTGVS